MSVLMRRKMSKAFYPTNDGYIGNLQKLSTRELLDLLKRQEMLLEKKRSLLNKLPDKGERVKSLLENLKQELKRRDTLSSIDKNATTKVIENTEQEYHQCIHAEQLSPGRLEGQQKDSLLESDLEQLSVNDSVQENGTKNNDAKLNDSVIARKQKCQFEVALERAEKNLQSGLRQPIKLNRALKIEHIKDLPEEITKMKCAKTYPIDKKQQIKMECNRVIEESAAVPPCYKFSKARQIDLTESLQLQEQQKQLQEELNAQNAAEKLAERLHVKMEAYNPEGVDMSYRSSRGGQFADNVDSDDDDEENVDTAGYSMTLVPSDTED